MQNLVELNSFNRKCVFAIAELVRDCEVIDGEAIYNAIEEAGTPEVDGYDLESWYDNCGDECYAGPWRDLEDHTQEAHELRMAVKEQVFDCIEAQARKLAGK